MGQNQYGSGDTFFLVKISLFQEKEERIMPIIELGNGKKQIVPTEDGYWDDERQFSVEYFSPYVMDGEIVYMSKSEEAID